MRYSIYFLLFFPVWASAKINVVTTTTDIKWLVDKIGGEHVAVESLLGGMADPHYVEATPHFIGKAAQADILCFVGLDLEIGWVFRVLSRSSNSKIQPGGIGHCDVGKGVNALDIPKGKVDRSQGDIHPDGNPHYHLGPEAFLNGGKIVLNVLTEVDPSRAAVYQANLNKLKRELMQLKAKVAKILRPLKKKRIMEYHKEFTYFLQEFGLVNDGSLEELPGIPPSAGRLARVTVQAKERKVALLLVTEMSPPKIVKKFHQASNVPVVVLPLSILRGKSPGTYPELLVTIAEKMVAKVQE